MVSVLAVMLTGVGSVNVFHPSVPDVMFQVYGPASRAPSAARQMRTVWSPPSRAFV